MQVSRGALVCLPGFLAEARVPAKRLPAAKSRDSLERVGICRAPDRDSD